MADLGAICDDLRLEHEELDGIVAGLDDPSWDVPTPAEGWSVRDQISHLAFFDEQALAAAAEPERFTAGLAAAAADVQAFIDGPLERGRSMSPAEVLAWWRGARSEMLDAFGGLDPSERVPWFGPPMSPASFVSARLMETWAHGQDVIDALGVAREPTPRLRHVAHLGVRARRNSYVARGRQMPEEEVRVDVEAPFGETWTWNPDAEQSITGPALDFCLVVTQRRHPDDTALVAKGPLAREWLSIAQAFAGPPGKGRRAGQFA